MNKQIEITSLKSDNEYYNNTKSYEELSFERNNMLFGNDIKIKHPKKIGNFLAFFYWDNDPLICIGVHKLSLVITYEIILNFACVIISYTVLDKVFPYMKVLYYIFYLITLYSHLYLFLLNPGVPSHSHFSPVFSKSSFFRNLPLAQKKRDFLHCDICNITVSKEESVEHCDLCQICVKNYDHHCYWTGKCIGGKNIKIFYFFWIFTLIYGVWSGIVVITWAILAISGINVREF